MNRRGFLGGLLLAATAPAIVRAASLMRLRARPVWREISRIEISRGFECVHWEWSTDGLVWVPRAPVFDANTVAFAPGAWRISEPVALGGVRVNVP